MSRSHPLKLGCTPKNLFFQANRHQRDQGINYFLMSIRLDALGQIYIDYFSLTFGTSHNSDFSFANQTLLQIFSAAALARMSTTLENPIRDPRLHRAKKEREYAHHYVMIAQRGCHS